MPYETLLRQAAQQGIYTYEKPMKPTIKGLYADKVICINSLNPTTINKACILAEELGHYHTSGGNILDQTDIRNRKQELRARQWAYQCMIPFEKIILAHKALVSGRYDLADFLGVTEDFLQNAIDRYTAKYGLFLKVNQHYTILFDPLGVIEMLD